LKRKKNCYGFFLISGSEKKHFLIKPVRPPGNCTFYAEPARTHFTVDLQTPILSELQYFRVESGWISQTITKVAALCKNIDGSCTLADIPTSNVGIGLLEVLPNLKDDAAITFPTITLDDFNKSPTRGQPSQRSWQEHQGPRSLRSPRNRLRKLRKLH